MTTKQILSELEKAGTEQTRKTFLRHGAKEPFYGVKVGDIKKIMKKVNGDKQEIAMELYNSGISDAQYMAALMADGGLMKPKQLQSWANKAQWSMISEYSVPWVTVENEAAFTLALKWIDSSKPFIATSGWNTLGNMAATWPDEKLDIPAFKKLLVRVEKEIDTAPDRVKYCMNGFVIATGSYIKALTDLAMSIGKKTGHVEVDMGDTSCKVPFAPDYIKKVIDKGNWGKKKKTAKC